jgi:hypothetical protein
MERRRGAGAHGGALDRAGRGVDAARHVGRHHLGAHPVDRLDRARHRLARRAREACAQQRVHHPRGPLQSAGREGRRRRSGKTGQVLGWVAAQLTGIAREQHFHLAPPGAQHPGGHEAVAAVVALAAHHGDPAVGHALRDDIGQPGPRPLHEVERRDSPLLDRPGVDGAHLRRVG